MTDEIDPALVPAAAAMAANAFTSAAIVAALVKCKLVDVEDVAAMADFFAANIGQCVPVEIQANVAEQLTGFATMIRSMATMPAGAGRA